jgi:hypothetical protein
MWAYGTCGLSTIGDATPLELHLFSDEQNIGLVEALVATAHYHKTGSSLNVGHTINIGRPWVVGSKCEFGLISLPYLDGPRLECLNHGKVKVRFLWVIPITKHELEFKKLYGLNALEDKLEAASFNYLDLYRESVV